MRVCACAHVCEHAWVHVCKGVMMETWYASTVGLRCKFTAAPLPKSHGRGEIVIAFPCDVLSREHRRLRLASALRGPDSTLLPGASSPSSWLSDPQPIHLQVLFLFICFASVFCKYLFLILDMQGSIEILEWGEGRMTGSFYFFLSLLDFGVWTWKK